MPGPPHPATGHGRTTDEAMSKITAIILADLPSTITVTNNNQMIAQHARQDLNGHPRDTCAVVTGSRCAVEGVPARQGRRGRGSGRPACGLASSGCLHEALPCMRRRTDAGRLVGIRDAPADRSSADVAAARRSAPPPPRFRDFVLAHINTTSNTDDIGRIEHQAKTACPTIDGTLCKQSAGAACEAPHRPWACTCIPSGGGILHGLTVRNAQSSNRLGRHLPSSHVRGRGIPATLPNCDTRAEPAA